MTREEALGLQYGDILYHGTLRDATGGREPQRWRVVGRVRTWKRDPGRIEVPVKRGMRQTGVVTEHNLDEFFVRHEEALRFGEIRQQVPALGSGEADRARRRSCSSTP